MRQSEAHAQTLYILEHRHEWDKGEFDHKHIGIYSTRELAIAAQKRRAVEVGFCESADCFFLGVVEVDRFSVDGIQYERLLPPDQESKP